MSILVNPEMPALSEKMIIKYLILFCHGRIFNDLRIIRRSQIYNLIRQKFATEVVKLKIAIV